MVATVRCQEIAREILEKFESSEKIIGALAASSEGYTQRFIECVKQSIKCMEKEYLESSEFYDDNIAKAQLKSMKSKAYEMIKCGFQDLAGLCIQTAEQKVCEELSLSFFYNISPILFLKKSYPCVYFTC